MNVPLDKLYHFLDDVTDHDLLIYRWKVHGSKKLVDVETLKPLGFRDELTKPSMICHDQEPLNFELYTDRDFLDYLIKKWFPDHMSVVAEKFIDRNLHCIVAPFSVYDKTLLLHSEKNSNQLQKYQNLGFIPVFYWSHAIIARDWFRYAEVDKSLTFDVNEVTNDFLIYNRAWTGTREYRLTLTEEILNHGLTQYCNIKFNSVDNGTLYTDHVFFNSTLAIKRTDIEKYIPINNHDSASSADYNSRDYKTSGIELVCETLFDDSRLHLTEKILRPIACGKPFILLSAPRSLQYLKEYGFKTFDGLIDESYDTVLNSKERLDAVVKEIKKIVNLNQKEKQQLWIKLHEISQENKKRFFSQSFFDHVINEYAVNLNIGLKEIKNYCSGRNFYKWRKILKNNVNFPHREVIEKLEKITLIDLNDYRNDFNIFGDQH